MQAGETLHAIAENYYGNTKYAGFLLESNKEIKDPHRLSVGMAVKIPPKPENWEPTKTTASEPATGVSNKTEKSASGRRTYKVRQGDSFYKIAKDTLGDGSRWRVIFELNKQLVNGDPKELRAGQTIVLPDSP